MPEVVGPWLLPADRPRQPGLVPDAVEQLPDGRSGDLVFGGRDEEPLPGRAELLARCLIAGGQDLDNLTRQGQPAAAVALGPQHVDAPLTQVDAIGAEQAGLPCPQTTRMHQGEKRDRLPPPRVVRVKAYGGSEESFDLLGGQQVGVSRNERGLPLVGEYVGVAVSVRLKPPTDVADVGHPQSVSARGRQLRGDPSFDGLAVENGPIVGSAVGVEPLQVSGPGTAVEAHLLLERKVGVQLRRERAGEAVGAHDRAPSGTSSTHCSSRS